jgi:hypothetical protein
MPLNWREEGEWFAADWSFSKDREFRYLGDERFYITPLLVQTYSKSKQEYVGEPRVSWVVAWGSEYLQSWGRDLLGDDFESPLFSLRGAMRRAEYQRFLAQYQSVRFKTLRRWVGLQRLDEALFWRWLNKEYPKAERWARFVDTEALRRLKAEGVTPTRYSDY